MKKCKISCYAWAVATLLISATSCTTSRLSQQFTPEQARQLSLEIEQTNKESVAAAQSSLQPEFRASELLPAPEEKTTEDALASHVVEAPTHTTQELKTQIRQQKMNAAQRLIVKAAFKKLEKAEVKKDTRQQKTVQKGKKGSSEYKAPLFLGAGGLLFLIIGLAAGIGIVYILGALALSAAVLWAILILAGVI